MPPEKIGFIGLGMMGTGMARNLMHAVGTIYVFDQRPEAVLTLKKAGAIGCDSPAQIAEHCDLIFLCLPFAPQVRSAIFGPQGIQSAGRGGITIVDTTTLDRTDAIAIAKDVTESGISYWDSPVSGLPLRAENGTLTVMFGGSRNVFDNVRPYLDSFGEAIYCGEIGSGQAMKAINNIIYNVNIAALCEVLPLAVAVGLDADVVASVVTSGSSRSFASTHFVPKMLAGQFTGDFLMGDAYKDIVNVQKMGIDTRASLPVVNAMIASYQAAMAAGFASESKSAMLKVYEKHIGFEFRSNQENVIS